MQKIAICPGSFDPVTMGHLDIIRRASKMFDRVIVLVMTNHAKQNPLFSPMERVDMIRRVTTDISNVVVDTYDGLLAEYASAVHADVIVKGLRAVTDFEYEFQQALINKKLNPYVETVFITTQAENMFLSSSIVKQICSLNGDISDFVPECILDDIIKRLARKDNENER